MDEKKDASLVCLNGHMINHRTHSLPESNKKFCPDCGEPTISSCPNCKTDILGAIPNIRQKYVVSETESKPITEIIWSNEPKKPSEYCHNCGKPYPWMVRKMQAVADMIDLLDEISPEEKCKLKTDIPDIIHNSFRSEVAGMRFKNAIDKIKGHTQVLFMNLLSNSVYEGLKVLMGLVK